MKATLLLLLITCTTNLYAQIPGTVTDTIYCVGNTKQSYALYLPSNYSEKKKWPVVYFFEPAARGSLPVKLYAEVAEELELILACTYNSRNGGYDRSFKAADALFLDTQNKFSIDYDKIILSGFSGGSRLALSIAVATNAAFGVVGVGASQPAANAYKVLSKKNFKYAGLVGARDMNYQEHKSFSSHLNILGMDNLLLISTLGHQWANAHDFRAAMLWMLDDTEKFQKSITTKYVADRDSIPLSDIIYLSNFIPNSASISNDGKQVKKTLKEESKIEKKEELLKTTISDSINSAFSYNGLNSASLDWVKRRIKKLKSQKEKTESIHEQMMFARLLNYISAACYETGLSMKAQGAYSEALIGFTIWEAVTENLTFGHWLKARVYASQENTSLAFDHLNAALKSGKIRKQSLFRESDFEGLQEDPRFGELINTYFN